MLIAVWKRRDNLTVDTGFQFQTTFILKLSEINTIINTKTLQVN